MAATSCLRPHLLARAIVAALFLLSLPVVAQEASPPPAASPAPEPVPATAAPTTPAPSPAATATPEAAAEDDFIWVDLCIAENEVCFSGVAARKVGEGWEVDLTTENLKEARVSPKDLHIVHEGEYNWVRLDKAEYDEAALKIIWSLPLSSLEQQSLMGSSRTYVGDVSEASYPFTTALGYSLTYGQSLSAVGDLTIGKKYTALMTSGSWSQETGEFTRGLTHIEHDQPAKGLRWSAGEILTGSPDPLGGGALVRGVGVARVFDTDPTLIVSARPNMTGVVDKPGTLEVYSNNMLISSQEVRPGPFSLEQVSTINGRQNIRIVLKDASGNRKTLMQTSYYGSNSLLAKGLSEYALRVGKLQQGAFPATDETQDLPTLAQGFWRKGISERWTLGVRAEGTPQVQSYGVSSVVATPVGELSLAAGSSSAGGRAYAASYSFSANKLAFVLDHRRQDVNYILPGQERAIDPSQRIVQSTQGSLSLGLIPRVGLSFSGGRDVFEDGNTQTRYEAQVGGELGRAQWGLGFRQTFSTQEPVPEKTVNLLLTVPLGPRRNVSFNAEQTEEGPNYAVSFTQGRQSDHGFSYGFNAQRSAEGLTGGTARVDYQGNHGLYAVQVDRLGNTQSHQIMVSGGVVQAGRNIFLTPPLSGSFAILDAPKAPHAPVVRENVDAGKTNGRGAAFIRNLAPYYPSTIGFDPEQLPIEINPGEAISKRVIPTPHTAAVVSFNAAPVFAAEAQLLWPDKVPVHYGSITFGAPLDQSISVGGAGALWIEGLKPGKYEGELQSEAGNGVCVLEIAEQKDPVQELGEVICKRTSEAEPPAPEEKPAGIDPVPSTTAAPAGEEVQKPGEEKKVDEAPTTTGGG